MKIMSTTQKLNLNEELDFAINKYFGAPFDCLSPAGKLMTAIAWDNYPDKSFDTLVESIRAFSPSVAESFSGYGINFRILSKGDSHRASGFEVTSYIACDTEEWYEDIPGSQRIWQEEDQESLYAKIQDAITQFEVDVCNEVEIYLKEKFDILPSQLVLLLVEEIDE
jgi:hypothetical protein